MYFSCFENNSILSIVSIDIIVLIYLFGILIETCTVPGKIVENFYADCRD